LENLFTYSQKPDSQKVIQNPQIQNLLVASFRTFIQWNKQIFFFLWPTTAFARFQTFCLRRLLRAL